MNNIPSGFYNAGFENISILDIAEMIKTKLIVKLQLKNQMTLEVTGKILQKY